MTPKRIGDRLASILIKSMRVLTFLALSLLVAACGRGAPASLPLGSAAPAFSLPGVDGRTHTLAEFAASPVLVVVFTCNHCPAAQRAEAGLVSLAQAYGGRGVAVVAINPDSAAATRLDDLADSDLGESLDDMKARAAFAHITYPYLSDASTPQAARAFRVAVTPQAFVFDRARLLRYEGAADGGASGDLREAVDALLADRAVPVAATTPTGCPPLWATDTARVADERKAMAAEPVSVDAAGPDVLASLRRNGTGRLVLVNFWATWCGPCVTEFPDLEATYRMYHRRGLEFVTVSTNDPEERPAVIEFLRAHQASHRNLQFATPDVYALQNAFDPAMPSSVPFTLLLGVNGDVLYQELGASDVPRLRRAILSNLPGDPASAGQRAYWSQQ